MSDLDLFFSTYAPDASSADVSFDSSNVWNSNSNNPANQNDNFVEAMLDIEYIAAMAPGVKTLVANPDTSAATEGGEAFGAALLAWLVELNGRASLPNVISMSLGSLSFGSCDKMCTALVAQGGYSYSQCWSYLQTQFQVCMFSSEKEEQRIDAEFQKLGLRGVTITAAAGDGGSHWSFSRFDDGSELGSALNNIVCSSMNMPTYPASSPYVLAVGRWQWSPYSDYNRDDCSSWTPCGWNRGGCGFSWRHAAPAYQAKTTPAAIALGQQLAPSIFPTNNTYNASGRAYPDFVSLAEVGIPMCIYGGCSAAGGTSAAAPTVGGMLSLVNDARLNAGKKPLGFLNTKLYQLMEDPTTYAECFFDIAVEHVNSGWSCGVYSSCYECSQGFVETKGWDAQTGFGQPNFAGWLKYLTK